MDKRYLAKNSSGNEATITKEMYERLKDDDNFECRVIDRSKSEDPEWPKPDESGSWYTLSDGSRVNGEANAIEAQKELDNG